MKLKIIILFLILFFVSNTKAQSSDASISKQVAKEKISQLRLRVIKGEKMEDIARAYSEDPGSSMKGGLYMNVGKGVMDPEFEKVAFSLKQGQISKVFETVYGYHFIQLVQRRGDLLDLRHLLIIPKAK